MKHRTKRDKVIEFWVSLVTWRGPKGSWRRGFTARQQRLIELLADPRDLRTKREKSRAAGYHAGEVYRLQQRPDFRLAVLRCAAEHVPGDTTISQIWGRTVGRAEYAVDRHGPRASQLVLELIRADAEAEAEGR